MKRNGFVESSIRRASLLAVCTAISMTCTLASAQMAAGKGKFVGNIIAGYAPSNYNTYWNQVTPENGTKWGAVEATQNTMNWTTADTAYNYAKSKGYKFKLHTLVWGSQEPSWVKGLSSTSQLVEVEQWMRLSCARYPDSWAVDVVNEPLHAVPSYKAALGGDGTTGWDWVITSFRLARQYCPSAKLLLNEYATEADATKRGKIKAIATLLKDRGLIDGIGLQAHFFTLDNMSAAGMKTALDDYAKVGLDIYISELDLKGPSNTDASQKAKYEELFPVMWTHASVKGITLWGYKVGETWSSGTGLLNTDGSERPALSWLKNYVSSSAVSSSSSSTSSASSSTSSASSSTSSASSSSSSASSSASSGTAPTLSGTGDYPSGFRKCANLGGTCSVNSGTGWVAFGRKGKWVTKNVGVGKSIACTVAAFGSDPGGNPNKCAYQP